MTAPHADRPADEAPEASDTLPSFTELVADQLGGVKGLIESSIPVAVFVITNVVWSLRPALYASVGLGVAIAVFRLARGEPVRHAVNGLFGIGLGAVLVARSGQARDFHLPTILWSLAYAGALILSILARWPLVGFIWSVTFGRGSGVWRTDRRLHRLFVWLTVLWAAVYLLKAGVLYSLWAAEQVDALGPRPRHLTRRGTGSRPPPPDRSDSPPEVRRPARDGARRRG
jgi:hypothetical protein